MTEGLEELLRHDTWANRHLIESLFRLDHGTTAARCDVDRVIRWTRWS